MTGTKTVVVFQQNDNELLIERTDTGWTMCVRPRIEDSVVLVDGGLVVGTDLNANHLLAIVRVLTDEAVKGTPGLVRVNAEQGLERSAVDPAGTLNTDVEQLLQIAANALDGIHEGFVDIVLDTPSEVQAAMLLELRGKGRLIRASTFEETPEELPDGRVGTKKGAILSTETVWRVSAANE